jgi:hypothetical protein
MNAGTIGVFIPIVAIVMGIGIGMLAIWAEHKRKAQLLEQLHRERLQALDKGMELPPLPPHLVGDGDGSAPSAAKSLRCGVMLVLIGVVLWFAIREVSFEGEGALFGLIPAAVGVGNLVYALTLWKKEKGE